PRSRRSSGSSELSTSRRSKLTTSSFPRTRKKPTTRRSKSMCTLSRSRLAKTAFGARLASGTLTSPRSRCPRVPCRCRPPPTSTRRKIEAPAVRKYDGPQTPREDFLRHHGPQRALIQNGLDAHLGRLDAIRGGSGGRAQ